MKLWLDSVIDKGVVVSSVVFRVLIDGSDSCQIVKMGER
jgi:hypothetical protein